MSASTSSNAPFTSSEPNIEPQTQTGGHEESHEHHGVAKIDLVRIGLVGVAVVFSWFRIWQPYPQLDLVGLVAVLLGGYPIYREALADIFSRRMTMELSMTIALAAALVIREVFTALVIVFFVLIAEVLEELTVEQGRFVFHDVLGEELHSEQKLACRGIVLGGRWWHG